MTAVPIYVWNGTAWQETGPTIPANPIKYQASAPSSPSTGDIWVDSDGDVTTGSQQFQRFRFVASGGETTISGADANGAVLAYTAGLEQVVLNGAVLVRGHDYTATNGTSITGLSPALVANDVLEVFSFIAFTVANTYTQSQVDGLFNSANGILTSLETGTLTGASVTTSTLSGSYRDLYVVIKNLQPATDATSLRMRFNGDANTRYNASNNVGSTSAFDESSMGLTGNIDNGTSNGLIRMTIPEYANTTTWKFVDVVAIYNDSTTATSVGYRRQYGFYNQTSAITTLTFFMSSGNLTSGTYTVYGVK
jgi:hypothetical protein